MNSIKSPMRVAPVIGDMIKNYTILSELGSGTFGTVYKVSHPSGKVLALKLLRLYDLFPIQERQNIARRFDLEFHTGRISSKNLVPTYEKGEEKGNPYFLMEYCPNGNLRDRVGLQVKEDFAMKMATDVLLGLRDLHQNGKIHRDIKPDNILISADGVAKLTDFGIAGHLNLGKGEFNDREIRLTTTDVFGKPKERFGSYPYMPPEQLKPSNRVVTKLPANDIFSFGVTLFEFITGELPFGSINSESDLANYIARVSRGQWNNVRKYRPDFSPIWEDVMKLCLEPDYKKRCSDVEKLLHLFQIPVKEERSKTSSPKTFSIKVMQGEEFEKVYYPEELLKHMQQGILTIGRLDPDATNLIQIKDELQRYISRHHATLERSELGWFLRDGQWIKGVGWQRSTNGTFINGKEITETGHKLNPGDIITIGDTTLKIIEN